MDGEQERENEGPTGDLPINRRNAVLDQIASTRSEMEAERGVPVVYKDEVAPAAEPDEEPEEDLDEEPEPQPTPTPPGESGDGAPPDPATAASQEEPPPESAPEGGEGDDDPEYEVKTPRGVQRVKLSELQRVYQLETASQERLDMAGRVLQSVEQMQQNLRPGAAEPGAEPGAEPKEPTEPAKSPVDGIDFADVANALQYKSPEEAAESLKALVTEVIDKTGGAANGGLTEEQIGAAVSNRIQITQANTRFAEDYEDIAKDPQLSAMHQQRAAQWAKAYVDDARVNKTDLPDYYTVLQKAGDDVRGWVDGLKGKVSSDSPETPDPGATPEQTTSSTISGRVERKRAAPQPPRARNTPPAAKGTAARPKSEAESRREGIDGIINSRRGQAA